MSTTANAYGNALGTGAPFVQYSAVGTPFGLHLTPGARVAAFVRSTGAQDLDDLFVRDNLVTSINEAAKRCRSGMNDVIGVLPNHVESVTAADGWSNLVAGSKIVSLGCPGESNNPTVTFSGSTAAQIAVDVANVSIMGMTFNFAGLDNIVNPILVTAAGFRFLHNHVQYQSATASAQPVDGIVLGAGAHNARINRNVILSDDAGEENAGSVILVGASAALGLADIEVDDNYIVGAITEAATDALIMVATTGSAVRIRRNQCYVLGATGDCAIRAANVACSGTISDNDIRLTENVAANTNGVIVGGGTWLLARNGVAGANASIITPTPAADS